MQGKGREMNYYFNSKRRIPTLFKRAAKVLKSVEDKKGLNNALYSSKGSRKECVSAIVIRVLKKHEVLEHLISNTPLCEEPNVDRHILKVILYHGVLDPKQKEPKLPGNNRPERLIIKHLAAIEKCLSEYMKVKRVASVEQLDTLISSPFNSSNLPRYVRINTLKYTKENVLRNLQEEGFDKVEYSSTTSYKTFIQLVKSLGPRQFLCDLQFDELLVFHPRCPFYKNPLYLNGTLILQDKSSLLPSTLLKPKPGSVILDCCAAPGFKTTHLAALMNNQCTVLASDKSGERMETMKDIVELHGATCVKTSVADFTKIRPQTGLYKKVRYILLDPSCSGSGMVKSRGLFGEDPEKVDVARLNNLHKFQSSLLLHAMSFPKVQKISYSTCSIHAKENEEVILTALEKFGHQFRLVKQSGSSPYVVTSPGRKKYKPLAGRYLKTNPKSDLTNGFFVAVFKRIKKEKQKKKKPKVAFENAI